MKYEPMTAHLTVADPQVKCK